MFRFIKRLSFIAVVLVVSLFGFKLFIENKLELIINQWVIKTSPYINIRFKQLDAKINGSVSLKDVQIKLVKINTPPITIERLFINISDLSSLYRLIFTGELDKIPDSLTMRFEGIDLMMLESPLLNSSLENTNKMVASQVASTCGNVYAIGPEQLKAMGYGKTILSNLGIRYQYDKFSDSLDLYIDTEMQGIGFITSRAVIENLSNLNPVVVKPEQLELSKLSLSYIDDGFLSRKIQYCADQEGIETIEYIEKETNQEDQYYSKIYGLIPNNTVKLAYGKLLTNPTSFKLDTALPSGFRPDHLNMYDSKDWLTLMNISLEVNGEPVDPVNLQLTSQALQSVFQKTKVEVEALSLPETDQQIAKVTAAHKSTFRKERDKYTGKNQSYQAVSTNSLFKYINRKIKVEVEKGKEYEGVFLGVAKERIQLRRESSSGVVTFPIHLTRIQSVQVLM